MLQAWIASPSGSLYFAAEATTCNLQNLGDHLRGMRRFDANDVRLALTLSGDEEEPVVAEVAEFLDRVAAEGVQVTFSVAPMSRPPDDGRARTATRRRTPCDRRHAALVP